MKKKCDKLLGILCYALGILAALYVGGWLMLIKPIHVIIIAFGNDMLTLPKKNLRIRLLHLQADVRQRRSYLVRSRPEPPMISNRQQKLQER